MTIEPTAAPPPVAAHHASAHPSSGHRPSRRRSTLRRTAIQAAAATTTLGLLLVGLLFAVIIGPRLFGWQTNVVASDSMGPNISTGDLVLVAPATPAHLAVGQVVRFPDPAHPDSRILHRIIEVTPDGMIRTKGDANPSADSTLLRPEQVDGTARLHLPALGLPIHAARDHLPAAAGFAGLLMAAAAVRRRRYRRTPSATRRPAVRRAVTAALSGLTILGITTGLAWQSSNATFTDTTSNTTDSFAAGAVTMSDDDGGGTPTTGTAMFTANGLAIGGAPASRCITVTYTGDTAAPVKLYATNPGGTGLGTYLNLTVEIGAGGSYPDCTGFTPSSTLFNGTGATYSATYTSFSTGLTAGWTPTTNGSQKTFRITYSVQNDPSAANLTVTANLVWEAQG
jgi:signal peptidase I